MKFHLKTVLVLILEKGDNAMKCVHCGNDIQKKDKDHLFPRSWYPDTTSEKVQRWTIPSCVPCNREYGEIEEEMLITIGLTTAPSHYASMGISQKAFNALDQSRAKNEKDRLARVATLNKIQGRLIHDVSAMAEGTILNYARPEDQNSQNMHGLFIPEEHLTMLCRKFVKGVTWIANKALIDDAEYIIDSSPMSPYDKIPYVENYWVDYSLPPGLIIKRIAAKEDPVCAIYFIMIWQQYTFYATCNHRNALPSLP